MTTRKTKTVLNINLQSRPDETVRPIALQVNTKVQNLPQLDPEQLTALETSTEATAKTGDLATVLSLIQTRRIAKGQSPQTPRTRAAVVASAVLVQLEMHGQPESWDTFAAENKFTPEEVTKAMPTVKTILELTK